LVINWHAFIGIGTRLNLNFFQSRLLLLLVLSSAISIGRRQLLLLHYSSSSTNTASSCPVRRHQHLCGTAMPWASWRNACANPD
jgi:hypothetical protein